MSILPESATTDEATATQIRAARPDASTWLTANAGSGKTRVLTDRVARLLLSGVEPQNILCLTYTKAAAGEMQNRLFQTLGAWAMQDDDPLTKALREKGVTGDLDAEALNRARRLFARAIETPGGLKIQTIHSFCAGLLRRFPMEAGISPGFTEMDDRSAERLRAEVLDTMAGTAGPARDALDTLAAYLGGRDLSAVAAEVMARAETLATPFPEPAIADALGIPQGADERDVLATAFIGGEDDLAKAVAEAFAGQSKTYTAFTARLSALNLATPGLSELEALRPLCLYSGTFNSKSANFPQKNHGKAVEAAAPIINDLHALMDRVARAFEMRAAIATRDRTRALYDFAAHFVPAMRRAMQDRGYLGFADFIALTRRLLHRPEVADWVLWRLDGGLDHILVDEAQDTSPEQWAVIQALASEMAAGQGSHADRQRTLFVVGDRKQSIYSFQGADPEEFDRMQAFFGERLARSATPLTQETLAHSFRSAPEILATVDAVFTGTVAEGLEADVRHKAFKTAMPGRVDLWDPVEAAEKDDSARDWTDPVDRTAPTSPRRLLAEQIASEIKRMLAEETIPQEIGHTGTFTRRPVRAGDILILVRGRQDGLYDALLNSCKSAGLPVAGADRMKLGAEMAVRDLVALLNFLALPEDDLSLATALRSPLFGWSERALYQLAQPRGGRSLWQALRERGTPAETVDILHDLRDNADFLRPFNLISRILIRHQGRQNLLARLGPEAEEGIDALLGQALAFEDAQIPGLTGFLTWLEAEDVEVKRQMGQAGDAIRIMTVHGAKGLEAPVVILPDTHKRRRTERFTFLDAPDVLLWPQAKNAGRPTPLQDLADMAVEADERESRRLLYVAMTRAEKWLIVAAAGDVGTATESWHGMISSALQDAPALPGPVTGKRIEAAGWSTLPLASTPASDLPAQAAFAYGPASHIAHPARPLAPSDLGGAKALPGDTTPDADARAMAMARGTALHHLLELLPTVPPPARLTLAGRILGKDPALKDLPETALRLLEAPHLAPLWNADTLAEVEITALLSPLGGRPISGAIDRLLVDDIRALAVDFKSNRVVPESPENVPEGILRQMGAYADALAQVFPDRRIETAILWTETATLMFLPAALTETALARGAR